MNQSVTEPAFSESQSQATARYRSFVLFMLVLVYALNFIDRQIIAILSPAIQAEFGVSDTAMGLLKGLAFALLYSMLGIPIARLADRRNRVSIIAVALAIWSGFTALSGMAMNFVQLALARFAVGVGEAGCSPPSHSLISDYFPTEKRAGALAVYGLGIPIGIMFAFLAGGYMAGNFGWRWTLILLGVPGVLFSLIFKLTVREPPRGAFDSGPVLERPPFRKVLAYLFSRKSFIFICLATSTASFSAFALNTWLVDFYFRAHDMGYFDLTWPLALIMGIGLGSGTYFGGAIADRLMSRSSSYLMIVSGVAFGLCVPLLVAALMAGSSTASLIWMFFGYILTGVWTGPTFAAVQSLAPVRMRATAAATFLLFANLIGMGCGPLVAGLLSDWMAPAFGNTDALRYAIIISFSGFLLSMVFYIFGARYLPADLEHANSESGD